MKSDLVQARKDESVVENFHGTQVADPYRWLEEEAAPETKKWKQAQDRRTVRFVKSCPHYGKLHERMAELWNYPRYGAPVQRGNVFFFLYNDGLQNQPVLYRQHGLEAEPEVVFDPNSLSKEGTVALTSYAITEDGREMAYALARSGSDWQEIHVQNHSHEAPYHEILHWCRYTGIAWKKDDTGFFYNRFPEPGTVSEADQYNFCQVYWHALGTPQSHDVLVYERPDMKELGFSPITTDDGQYLVLDVYHGTDSNNRVYYQKLGAGQPFVRLLDMADARYDFIGSDGPVFYFHTDLGAPHGRVIAIDITRPNKKNWREVIPETKNAITSVHRANQRFIVVYLQDAYHRLQMYSLDGKNLGEIELPTMGTVAQLSVRKDSDLVFLDFFSYLYPPTVFCYHLQKKRLTIFKEPRLKFQIQKYETRQVFFPSPDGTRVPMFLTHKKGLELNGQNPVLLHGYGGFQISLTPAFRADRLLWIEQGGIYAVANLRGGYEYGEKWHQNGMLHNKQNVFDDFIAAAEWLVKKRYTCPQKLAIYGRSNGGLLVGACLTQRPEMFAAVVCQNPVIDMLRYHKFTVGRYWMCEYGDVLKPDHFAFLHAYSPLHNVRPGINYPQTLVIAADHDDRVVPAHATKFVATLQEKAADPSRIFLRMEKKAGHGVGKPISKIIEEEACIYAFLFKALGMAWQPL